MAITETTIRPTVGVQSYAATAQRVSVHGIGGRVAVTFGDDRNGARLMGDALVIHQMIVEADRQLTRLKNDQEDHES